MEVLDEVLDNRFSFLPRVYYFRNNFIRQCTNVKIFYPSQLKISFAKKKCRYRLDSIELAFLNTIIISPKIGYFIKY